MMIAMIPTAMKIERHIGNCHKVEGKGPCEVSAWQVGRHDPLSGKPHQREKQYYRYFRAIPMESLKIASQVATAVAESKRKYRSPILDVLDPD